MFYQISFDFKSNELAVVDTFPMPLPLCASFRTSNSSKHSIQRAIQVHSWRIFDTSDATKSCGKEFEYISYRDLLDENKVCTHGFLFYSRNKKVTKQDEKELVFLSCILLLKDRFKHTDDDYIFWPCPCSINIMVKTFKTS